MRVGIPTTWEVMVVEGRQKRMDLVLHFATGRMWIDVSIVNPQAPAYVKTDATSAREKEKRTKWGEEARERNVGFKAFVLDTFGKVGGEALEVLKTIAHHAYINSPNPIMQSPQRWEGEYRRELVVKLCCALAHANHCIIEESGLKCFKPYTSTAAMYRGLLRKRW